MNRGFDALTTKLVSNLAGSESWVFLPFRKDSLLPDPTKILVRPTHGTLGNLPTGSKPDSTAPVIEGEPGDSSGSTRRGHSEPRGHFQGASSLRRGIRFGYPLLRTRWRLTRRIGFSLGRGTCCGNHGTRRLFVETGSLLLIQMEPGSHCPSWHAEFIRSRMRTLLLRGTDHASPLFG